MRHRKKGRKIGSNSEHGKAILRTMAGQLIEKGRLQTTETKAKELRSVVEKLITLGKKGDVSARRRALGQIENREVVHKLFTELAEKYGERAGGYTRISKIGPRQGDNAPLVFIEFV